MLYYILIALVGFWIVVAAGILLGLACVSIGRRRGPRFVRIIAGLGITLSSTLLILLGAATDELVLCIIAALVCSISLGLCVRSMLGRKTLEVQHEDSMAESVRDFGLTYFAVLDVDGDGLITAEDLIAALDMRVLELREQWLIAQMQDQISVVGHWIGSYRTRETGELRDEHNEVKVRRTFDVIHSRFGINCEDLKSYPQRAKRVEKRDKPAQLHA